MTGQRDLQMSAVFAKYAVLLERGLPALYCRLPFLRRVFGEFLPIRFCSGVKHGINDGNGFRFLTYFNVNSG